MAARPAKTQQELNKALMGAKTKKAIVRLLDEGADINVTNDHGQTQLMLAAYHNNRRLVDELLARGASTAVRDSRGVTALMEAAASGPDCVAPILGASSREEINAVDRNGSTALHQACFRHHGNHSHSLEVVSMLLSAGADPTILSHTSESCLHWCVKAPEKAEAILRLLLETTAGEVLEVKGSSGETPLSFAVREAKLHLVKILAGDYRADCNVVARDGMTPLAVACCESWRHSLDEEMACCLISCGARTDISYPAHFQLALWERLRPRCEHLFSTTAEITLPRRALVWALHSPIAQEWRVAHNFAASKPVLRDVDRQAVIARRLKVLRKDAWQRRRHLISARKAWKEGFRPVRRAGREEEREASRDVGEEE
jgi:ankyrin repeat protein